MTIWLNKHGKAFTLLSFYYFFCTKNSWRDVNRIDIVVGLSSYTPIFYSITFYDIWFKSGSFFVFVWNNILMKIQWCQKREERISSFFTIYAIESRCLCESVCGSNEKYGLDAWVNTHANEWHKNSTRTNTFTHIPDLFTTNHTVCVYVLRICHVYYCSCIN